MNTICLHDKAMIETALRRDTLLNIYALGDLDDGYWPYTTWYGVREEDKLRAVALLYSGLELPSLSALTSGATQPMRALLDSILHLLPARFYCHLTAGVEPALCGAYKLTPHGTHLKMALADAGQLEGVDTAGVVPLRPADADEVMALFERSYPGHWFEPQLLATGCYFGRRIAGRLVCAGGIHVYSPTYRVAALGNITTHPDQRGHGHAAAVTARICRHLMPTVDHIGLNVKSDNLAAIRCYERLGFERSACYDEYSATLAAIPT